MRLLDYIDRITRGKSYLVEQEQDLLFSLLDKIEDLYYERRSTRGEQLFWNQFWHKRDFQNLHNSRQQALEDMATDRYFHHIKENRFTYRNFETAVAYDLFRYKRKILYYLESDFSRLSIDIFFNLQRQVQEFLEIYDLAPIKIAPLISPPDPEPEVPVLPKEIEIAKSVKKEIAAAVAATKKETPAKRKKRLKRERKEKQRRM